jgi:hypothetical protein
VAVLLLVAGLLLVAFGVGIIPYIVRHKIIENIQLRNGSEAFNNWLSPPAAIYIDFHFFNVTNADEIVGNFTRPRVEELGPYVYREIRAKTDVEFINDKTSLRYREHKWYVFDRNLSCGDENDIFTTVNIPLVTILTRTRFMPPAVISALEIMVRMFGYHLFEQHSVKELLWGYHLNFPSFVRDLIPALDKPFGIYVGDTANGTDDGLYEIDTGINDISDVGEINGWRNSPALPFWTDTKCNMINGSDGTFWHPFVSKSERLYIFISDLCRSVYITYNESEQQIQSVHSIGTYHFTPPASVFDDPHKNMDNLGYCTPDCLLGGVLNVSECRDAPIIISQPHFYEADYSYQSAIDGIIPNPKYKTFIDIEPNTGIALNVSRQVQINIYLRQLEALEETQKMKNSTLIFPILWLNEHATINESESIKFKSEVLSLSRQRRSSVIACWLLVLY